MSERDGLSGTYVAIWQEADGIPTRGSLTLEPHALLLRGKTDEGNQAVCRIPFTDLSGVSIGRGPEDRLGGNPALLLARHSEGPLRISPSGTGLLSELADLLARLVGS